jgi:hypothetical protein
VIHWKKNILYPIIIIIIIIIILIIIIIFLYTILQTIECRRGEIFRTCPDRPWGPPNILYNGYWAFPGGNEVTGRDAESPPRSSAVVMKE